MLKGEALSNSESSKIIVALDYDDYQSCMALVKQLDPALCRLKVGKELFTSVGPKIVDDVQNKGFDVFLDLKFHDIPNTVGKAVKAAANLGVWMVNVHASGGAPMMENAREQLAGFRSPPLLIAVTVLTSMDQATLTSIGVPAPPREQVLLLAELARQAGMDGVVCSARETVMLKSRCGADFVCVTPGIRPADSAADDQKRIVTPAQAIRNGSDFLVIGRPITRAADPLAACRRIVDEISAIVPDQPDE